jgi:hypothetical protein
VVTFFILKSLIFALDSDFSSLFLVVHLGQHDTLVCRAAVPARHD